MQDRIQRLIESGCHKITFGDGDWHHSEFPHPLVTLDYDRDGNLLAVTAFGSVESFGPEGELHA